MMNPLLLSSEIQSFLESFPSKSRRRGRHYFADQAVREVLCIKTDRQYAALVDGGQEYEVVFDYDPQTHCWSVECTCPVTFECKHAFAAMLALQANAAKLSVADPVPGAKPNRKGK